MRSIVVLLLVAFGGSQAFPKEEFKFKRLYVDPLEHDPEIFDPRIINGVEAVPHSIPYQAYLIVTGSDGRWLCGGSLISRKYVLTAGHCVDGGISALVYLGAHNVQTQETTQLRITSTSLKPHERFDLSTISYDIGVIGLPQEIEFNEYISAVDLPTRAEATATYLGDNARVSGWGLTTGAGSTSPVLMEVNSTVIDNASCNAIYGIVQNYQVCISGQSGVGSCNGDSGGPLVAGNTQIGVVSYGASQCPEGYPSAFTRTNSFLDWLQQNTDLVF